MKWIVLAVMLLAIPLLVSLINDDQRRVRIMGFLLGFLAPVLAPWHLLIAPVSWAIWSGYVKGLEISVLDIVALAVVLSRPIIPYSKPFKVSFFAYIFAVALAVSQSSLPTASWFYVWQLMRMGLVYAAVAKIAVHDRCVITIISGMVASMLVMLVYSIIARANGAIQTGGALSHQNLLGMLTHMVSMPCFALLLSNRHRWLAGIGLLSCVIAVILTASRASIGFGAAGLALVFILSVMHRPNGSKWSWGMIIIAALLVAYPFAQNSLQRRYDSQIVAIRLNDNGYDERDSFEKAARLMIKDHPMGVGSNMYVDNANKGGYSQKAGVIWNSGSRSANVHNFYLLINAETGYLGLITFFCLFCTAIFTTFKTMYRFRRDPRSDLLVGIGCALLVVAAHNFFEWIFILYQSQYFLAILLGLVAGLRQQLRTTDTIIETQNIGPPLVKLPKLSNANHTVQKFG